MGLHDGVASPGASGNGSSADLALLTGWPVVLVILTCRGRRKPPRPWRLGWPPFARGCGWRASS